MKRLRKRSGLLTVALFVLSAVGWHYFAPVNLGGSTRYVVTSGVSMEPRFHTGDLAIVRPAATYKVGEIVAYHSTLLHVTVLHRIIAIRDGRYVFKGDNNDFIDPVQPTRNLLQGKLWIHIPHAGLILKALHTRFVAAVLCAVVGIFALFGFREERKRRKRRRKGTSASGRHGIPLVNSFRVNNTPRHLDYVTLLAASAIAAAVFTVLVVIAFTRPDDKPAALTSPYRQQVTFGYNTRVHTSPVYPSGAINTGDPIFLSIVRRLNVEIDYRLLTAAPHTVRGTESVVLTLFGPSGWSRTFVLAPPTHFVGDHTSTDVPVSLPRLQALLAEIERLTDSPGFASFSLAVGPQVHITGTVAGHPIKASFAPILSLAFEGGQLIPGGGSGSSGTGSGGSSTNSSDSQASFVQSQSASVTGLGTNPSSLTVLGASIEVSALRWIALVGLLLSLLGVLVSYLCKRGTQFEETHRIQSQYGHLIVPVVAGEDLGWPPVDVPNIKALARLAESGQRLILHSRTEGVDTYMVNDEGTVYRYQVRPSKVIWGEWSEAATPVQAAA